MSFNDYPISEPIAFKLAWLHEQRSSYQSLLVGLISNSNRDDDIKKCLEHLEGLEDLEHDICSSSKPHTSLSN